MARAQKKAVPKSEREDDHVSAVLANRIHSERQKRSWTIQELADHSGVSRAMISKIERLETSPTATILSRLGSAFGFSLSELLAEPSDPAAHISRRKDQQVWQDPETGYKRRAVSPAAGMPLQLVEVILPAMTSAHFPAIAYVHLHQQVWVLRGHLTFVEGADVHELATGDCLQLRGAQDCIFRNRSSSKECHYVVALIVKGNRSFSFSLTARQSPHVYDGRVETASLLRTNSI